MTPGLLVTGTDTGVGKTYISCGLIRAFHSLGIQVNACKPAVSGAVFRDGVPHWDDPEHLAFATGNRQSAEEISPHRFLEPLAPNVAARRDSAWQDAPLTFGHYKQAIEAWMEQTRPVLVEGVGGLLCPITDQETIADLAAWWGRPVLVVARLGLGTINHTLLTLEAAHRRGLSIVGVVVNESVPTLDDPSAEFNPAELRRLLDVPVWGPIRHGEASQGLAPSLVEVAQVLLDRWSLNRS